MHLATRFIKDQISNIRDFGQICVNFKKKNSVLNQNFWVKKKL